MGADEWEYFVPYQPDIEKALQELRQREFAAGHYGLHNPVRDYDMSFKDWVENPDMTIDDYDEEELAQMRADYDHLRELTTPATIEELLWCNGPEGTGTILDMQHTAAEPAWFAVAPLSAAQLIEIFGTDRPTRAHLEQKDSYELALRLQGMGRERAMGTSIILYRDGAPDEIYFTGYSGD